MKKMDSTKEISMMRQNSLYHNKADRKADSVSTPKPKKGDSRSRQTMKNISPQAPAGKYHG